MYHSKHISGTTHTSCEKIHHYNIAMSMLFRFYRMVKFVAGNGEKQTLYN